MENVWLARKILARLPFETKRNVFKGKSAYCPVCDTKVQKFLNHLETGKPNSWCPICESEQRHRLDLLFFRKNTNLFDSSSKKMLHVAPELSIKPILQREKKLDYITADLNDPDAMVKMDITEIQFPDETFDVIYCSHVLEHVIEDWKAMGEFYRVLKTGCWAVLQVPINVEVTEEDFTVDSDEERLRLYGQIDHVRNYGRDYKDRLEKAGFEVRIFKADEIVSKDALKQMSIAPEREVYFCKKN